ncbi:hypothetical protein IE81DRAFT_346432 [Ceraceosorus guamensis]|uniref:Uncharacterized protein n=1 Tax=Ceraceosorus guamensis TaxID=1522189 RepID=A0A316W282_9BASI|nr:hypothetical protein IE81DRAFT_346432 [Ceraceosorus guamensis]PWN43634.1 hypothetical protein IE81DRAFT_346432 [Ceraceosorus guamensis]
MPTARSVPVPRAVPKVDVNAVNFPICVRTFFAEGEKSAQGNATALRQLAYMKSEYRKLYAFKRASKLAHQKELQKVFDQAIVVIEKTLDVNKRKYMRIYPTMDVLEQKRHFAHLVQEMESFNAHVKAVGIAKLPKNAFKDHDNDGDYNNGCNKHGNPLPFARLNRNMAPNLSLLWSSFASLLADAASGPLTSKVGSESGPSTSKVGTKSGTTKSFARKARFGKA